MNDDTQGNLFDAERAERAKQEAIDRVEYAAPDEWLADALAAVHTVAKQLGTFTTDDVWLRLDRAPPEPRALGAVMRSAQSNGWIRPTSRYKQSVRVACHRRPVRVWESLV